MDDEKDGVQVAADEEAPESDETVAVPPAHPTTTDEAEVDDVDEVPAEEVAAPMEDAA